MTLYQTKKSVRKDKESSYQPKKLLIMNILDILRKYSDPDHRISQKDIIDILKNKYNMVANRKAIRRNIMNLMDLGYNIEYKETVRMVPNKVTGELEESYLWSNYYYVSDFSDSELRLLIDSLIFSKHIPYSQRKELIEKLEGLSNIYFKSRIKHISVSTDYKLDNKELFYIIDVLDDAISNHKKYPFTTMNTEQTRNYTTVNDLTAA